MIKILVVDDLQSKREKIVKTILDNHDILEKNIIQAKCVNEAKKILYQEYFDLMILDLRFQPRELSRFIFNSPFSIFNFLESF